ncbi:hypothetical protein L210DRAFT_847231 [Boletus edulis BED1]|uniref:C2H2-type domain-containing protein n=1 Tax=Boletus edulis BED1 TaxID=1328754 RepID=A0AAD4GK67_BOLED|nr:hypothetical protein L210DRAFT_847231 [Boletus edulis BED1]
MSKDTLSKEEIIHLAHNVIQTMQCEWEECTITLNSWDSLAKHLRRHCSRVKQQNGIYHCSYSRCSGRLHSSLAALKTHMELSHLSRVALPCPARGCKEVFIRVQQLPSHFEHVHRELLDIRVSVNAFAPLARLARPRRLQRLPPLPRHEIRVSSFLPSVSMPSVRREHSQASASQTMSRKWSRLNVQDQEGESDEDPIAFGNLPLQLQDILAPLVVDTEVRKKPPFARQPLLSRPQPAIHPPIRSNGPKQTILYSTFKPMVDKLVADGTLAEHKEGGM